MVLNFADLEIDLQWKWLFRPRQRDGVKVEDYYTQFCVWRQEMVSLSFPAEEEDYIAGFIENLRWDIRWRLSKYECSRYRLTNAFYNAKFEETSLSIEASMKQIRAHKVFDDMPSQTPISLGGENADCNDDDISEVDSESNEQQQTLGYDESKSAMAKFDNRGHKLFTEMSELNPVDITACNERCEPNVHKVEAFIATPIAGIPVASNYEIRFEGETHDISFDGMENVMESDACSEVCKVLDELPDSEEILDLDVLMGNDPEETGPNRGNKDETGLQVLSIYCVHMASKWNSILELRPKQSKDMSVEVYYDLFFNWKLQLDKVNYIGGEESYIDDFLYGLEIKLGMRVWGYKWKPRTLYGAFRRAVIEEIMMKNEADMALEEMPHPKSIDNPSAKDVSDECGNIVRDASLGEFTIKVSWIEEDNESSQLLFQNPVRLNEGNVVDGGVVFSLFDLQASLSPLGDLTAYGSWNYSTKAWYDDATSTIKIVSGKRVMEDDAYKVFGEITRTIRAALLDEQVIPHYAKYANFNELILFDPGGSRTFVMSFGREVARLLFGEAHELFEVERIVSSHWHANSFLDTGKMHRLTSSCLVENEWVSGPLANLSKFSIQYLSCEDDTFRVSSTCFPSISKLGFNPLVFDPGTKANVAKLTANGVQMNRQCIGAVIVGIFAHVVRCRPFDPGGNLLCQMEGNILKTDTLRIVLVIIQSDVIFIFVWDTGQYTLIDYILVDKDVFIRVGKWMILIDHTAGLTVTMPMFMNLGEDHIGLQQAGNVAFVIARSFQLGNRMKGSGIVMKYYEETLDLIWWPFTQHRSVPPIYSFMLSHLWVGYIRHEGSPGDCSYGHLKSLILHNTNKNLLVELVTMPMFIFFKNWCRDVKATDVFEVGYSCKDEALVNFEWKFQKLVSWAINNDLSFVEVYLVRMLKVRDADEFTGYAMRILEHIIEYRHDRYSVRSKIVWGQFSTGWLSWLIEDAEYITMKIKRLLNPLKHEGWSISNAGIFAAAMMFPFVLVILKNLVWDPGIVWACHFTTLRTRRLLRGRTCHDPRFKSNRYELLSVTDVICDVIALSMPHFIF